MRSWSLSLALCLFLIPSGSRAQPLRLTPARVLLTDESADGPALTRRIRLAVHESGRLVLVEGSGSWVGQYDATHRTWKRIGRKGRGPGEYEGPLSVGWRGDTLWIADDATRRLTLLAAFGTGKPVTRQLQSIGDVRRAPGLPLALLPGRMLTTVQSMLSNNRPAEMLPTLLVSVDRHNESAVDTLLTIDERHTPWVLRRGSITTIGVQPFRTRTEWATSSNGRFLASAALVTGQSGILGTAVPPTRITVRDLTNPRSRAAYTMTIPGRAAPTSAEIDAVVQEGTTAMNRGKPRNQEVSRAEYRRSLHIPSFRIAVNGVLVANDGSLLAMYDDVLTHTTHHRWIDAAGRSLGTFSLPFTQRIHALQGNRIWSMQQQEDETYVLIEQEIRR